MIQAGHELCPGTHRVGIPYGVHDRRYPDEVLAKLLYPEVIGEPLVMLAAALAVLVLRVSKAQLVEQVVGNARVDEVVGDVSDTGGMGGTRAEPFPAFQAVQFPVVLVREALGPAAPVRAQVAVEPPGMGCLGGHRLQGPYRCVRSCSVRTGLMGILAYHGRSVRIRTGIRPIDVARRAASRPAGVWAKP